MGGSHGHFTVFTQAEKHSVPTYIVGFVIGTAALCVAVISPLCGYLVSHLIGCDLSALGCSLFLSHNFFPAATSSGSEVHTARWTAMGRRSSDSLWVLIFSIV